MRDLTGEARGLGLDGLADLLVDAGDGDEDGGLDGLHGGGKLVELGAVGEPGAVHHEGVVDVAGGDVREGEEGDAGVFVGEAEGGGGVAQVGGHVAVGEHDALGLAGGAGGVDDGHGVAGTGAGDERVEGGVGGLEGRGGGHEVGEGVDGEGGGGDGCGGGVHDDDVAEGGENAGELELCELVAGGEDEDLGGGVAEHVADLVGGEGGVEGDVDGAEGEGGEVGDGPLPAILAEEGDAVATLDAPVEEVGGEGADAAVEILGGDGQPGAGGVLPEHGDAIAGTRYFDQNIVRGRYFEHVHP